MGAEVQGCVTNGCGSGQPYPQGAHRSLEWLDTVPVTGLSVPELRDLATTVGRIKSKAEAKLCEIAAAITRSGTCATPASVLQDDARMSGRDARQMARVAKHLTAMPNTAERLSTGDITLDHAASLASAAERCGTRLVDSDAGLLERAGSAPCDLFAIQARQFTARHSPDQGEALLQRQRRARTLALFEDRDTGMGKLIAELDPISHSLVEQAIDSRADALYRDDSGRDGRAESVRTYQQRRADSLFELVTNRDASTHQPLAAGSSRANGHPEAVPANGPARGSVRVGSPNHLVVVAELGVVDGTDPGGRCEILGVGPVPASVLARLSPDTSLAGMIFAGDGQPLWLGRSRRLANAPQQLAVAVRDRGCVICDAPMHRCEIHHVRAWHDGGTTDVTNLVALCHTHHRRHHDRAGPRHYARAGPG